MNIKGCVPYYFEACFIEAENYQCSENGACSSMLRELERKCAEKWRQKSRMPHFFCLH